MELYRVIGGRVYVQRDGESKAAVVARALLERGHEETYKALREGGKS